MVYCAIFIQLIRYSQVTGLQSKHILNALYPVNKEKTRVNVARELLSTERTYVENLGTLIEVSNRIHLAHKPPINKHITIHPCTQNFLSPLEKLKSTQISAATPLKQISVILRYSRELLEQVQEKVSTWTPASTLGDVFLEYSEFMKVYTQYIQDYDTLRSQLAQKAATEDTFRQYLQVNTLSIEKRSDLKTCLTYMFLGFVG
jgi:hypothetical protein